MDDGWIEWTGGECPVDGATVVDVLFGAIEPVEDRGEADIWLWHHEAQAVAGDYQIVAYRIAS